MQHQPDLTCFVDTIHNRRSRRLTWYEHHIHPDLLAAALGEAPVGDPHRDPTLWEPFIRQCIAGHLRLGYDVVSWEVCPISFMERNALCRGLGPIQNRADLDRYPFDAVAERTRQAAERQFSLLAKNLPPGLGVVGGIGTGMMELLTSFVGYESLCLMLADDPELVADLARRLGDFQAGLWTWLLDRFPGLLCVARFGDDLGFKTGPLLPPSAVRDLIVPSYRRIVALAHARGLPFLLHTCGDIFCLMDDLIATGIDAKHSNEDVIAPFDTWIERYGQRIGLCGGIDVDVLARSTPDEVRRITLERGRRWRAKACGWALGSGNSIPKWMPLDNYRAMIDAAFALRAEG